MSNEKKATSVAVEPNWNPEIVPFRAAAAARRLALKRCSACGQTHYYPRTICPFCFSDRTTWFDASGKGVVYSFSIQRRVPQPYVIAFVTLEEGPTMMTHVVGLSALESVYIGQPVELDWQSSPDGEFNVPVFRPVHNPEAGLISSSPTR